MWTLCPNTAIGFHHYEDTYQSAECEEGHKSFTVSPIQEHIEVTGAANRRRHVLEVGVAGGSRLTTPPQPPALRVLPGAGVSDDQLPTGDESGPQNVPNAD